MNKKSLDGVVLVYLEIPNQSDRYEWVTWRILPSSPLLTSSCYEYISWSNLVSDLYHTVVSNPASSPIVNRLTAGFFVYAVCFSSRNRRIQYWDNSMWYNKQSLALPSLMPLALSKLGRAINLNNEN